MRKVAPPSPKQHNLGHFLKWDLRVWPFSLACHGLSIWQRWNRLERRLTRPLSPLATFHFTWRIIAQPKKKKEKSQKSSSNLKRLVLGQSSFTQLPASGRWRRPPPLAAVTSTASSNQLIDQGKSADNFPFTVSLGHGTDRKCSRHRKQRLFPARKR